MSATIKDVAREAGVSTATVSRVVNNDPRISPATRKKVQTVIDRLHYKVNSVARSLKNKRTLTVGLLVPEIANVFFMRVAQGVEDRLTEQGYSMIVLNSRESAAGEKHGIELLLEKQVDGAIVIPGVGRGSHFGMFRDAGVPIVLVDRMVEDYRCDAVLVDNEDAVYRAVSTLWLAGHRDFGFIGGQSHITTAAERYQGFVRAIRDSGGRINPELTRFGDFHTESGYHLFKELMGLPQPPRTVVIANYFMQIGALRYAARHRDQLPPDLFLASFDDSDLAAVAGIPSLSISQPIDDIGRRAADILVSRLRGTVSGPPRIERLATEIIENGGLQ